jgi:hypothetical protein
MDHGIDKLKKAIAAIIGLGVTVNQALADDKITAIEWGKISFKGVALAVALKDIKGLKLELKDLTEEEKDEIIAYVNEMFDIENDAIEATIEEAFAILFRFATSFLKAA